MHHFVFALNFELSVRFRLSSASPVVLIHLFTHLSSHLFYSHHSRHSLYCLTFSLQVKAVLFPQILHIIIYLWYPGLSSRIAELARNYHADQFIFSLFISVIFCLDRCSRLRWLPISFDRM